MTKKKKEDRTKDKINCPGESYLIERTQCEARRARNYKYCKRCPENTDQLSLFESPRQVLETKKKRRRRRTKSED